MCMSTALRPAFAQRMNVTLPPSGCHASATSAEYFICPGPRKIARRTLSPRTRPMSTAEGWTFSKSTRMWVRFMARSLALSGWNDAVRRGRTGRDAVERRRFDERGAFGKPLAVAIRKPETPEPS
jgi:hypothetical protein